MTMNLLFWMWSSEYDTPAKRKRVGVKFSDITSTFAESGDHPAIGDGPIAAFRQAIDEAFEADEYDRPFVFYDYDKCAVINYPNAIRFDLVPKLAAVGKKFGLNASEF